MDLRTLKDKHPRAFEAAYTTWREGEGDPCYDWYDSTIEQLVEDAKERGFLVGDRAKRGGAKFYFSGFWSQGDGASWEGHVDVPKWIEWMRENPVERGMPFTEAQLLWIDEAYRNDMLGAGVTIVTRGNYSHSYGMHLSDDIESVHGDGELTEGIFAGMDWTQFNELFTQIVGETLAKEVLNSARAFADEGYKTLEEEFEYLTSEEHFIELKMDEDVEYDEEGNEVETA